MVLYPTEEWLVEYRRCINDHTRTAGWDREFTGECRFVITDVPLDETRVRDLPREAFDGLPKPIRWPLSLVALDGVTAAFAHPLFATLGRLGGPLSLASAATLLGGELRETLPERTADLLRQIDEHVIEGTIYAFVRFEDGDCTAVGLLDGPDEREADFVIRGPNGVWGAIVDGERDVFSAAAQGTLTVDGDPERILKHADMFGLLGEAAANVETTRLF